MPKRRNPVVRDGSLLRKGGVHTKSQSGNRQRLKRQISSEIDEWKQTLDQSTLIVCAMRTIAAQSRNCLASL